VKPAPGIALLWRELENAGLPSAEKVRFKEGGKLGDTAILVGIDGLGHRHVCVPAPDSDRGKQDTSSRGVSIEVRELLAGTEPRQFVDVKCSIPALNELFSMVAGDMLEQLARDSARPFNTCHEVLERWRELLERERGAPLGREQLAALMAELLVLERLVKRQARSVEGWLGPEKAVHDFVCGAVDLEVKSSLRTSGHVMDIHGLSQLEAPRDGALYLNFTRLRFSPGRGRSVPEVIDSIATSCSDRSLLLERLALVGYDPADRKSYEQTTFEVTEELWFIVDDAFPGITRTSFLRDEPPSAVTRIDYVLDLDASPVSPLDGTSCMCLLDEAAEAFTR